MNIHPLEPLISQYLVEKDIVKETRELYQTVLKQYVNYLKDHQIMYAETSNILDYVEWKKEQGFSSGWIYQQISTVKGFYRYLKDNQLRLGLPRGYGQDIAETIKNVRVKPRLSKAILTPEQGKHLIECTKKNRKYIWQYRDYAMVYLMLTTALRSIEIRRARIKDLRFLHKDLVLYIQGKGKQSADDFVKIAPGVGEAIRDYLKKRKDKNPFLFVSHSQHSDAPYLCRTFFKSMFQRILKDCDLEDTKITPHSLRHSAATFNLLRGSSLESTRKFMRHTSSSVTMIYAHHINKMEDDSEKQIEDYILKGKTDE